MSWLNLEGKVAVVTGGACGIGKAVCEGGEPWKIYWM